MKGYYVVSIWVEYLHLTLRQLHFITIYRKMSIILRPDHRLGVRSRTLHFHVISIYVISNLTSNVTVVKNELSKGLHCEYSSNTHIKINLPVNINTKTNVDIILVL